jgi:hypothetical protein
VDLLKEIAPRVPYEMRTADQLAFKSYAFAHPLRDHQALPIASLFYHEWRNT